MKSEKRYRFKIKNACSESWNKMDNSIQGRFCTSCQKHVHDFSDYSDEEIVDHLLKAQGRVCGRLRPEQNNRAAFHSVENIGSLRAAQLLLPAALSLSLMSGHSSTLASPTQGSVVQSFLGESQASEKDAQADSITIRGIVYDAHTEEALPYANVVINDKYGATTGLNGEFVVLVPNKTRQEITVRVTYVGYETIEKTFALEENSSSEEIVLRIEASEEFLLGVMILEDARQPKRSFWPFR